MSEGNLDRRVQGLDERTEKLSYHAAASLVDAPFYMRQDAVESLCEVANQFDLPRAAFHTLWEMYQTASRASMFYEKVAPELPKATRKGSRFRKGCVDNLRILQRNQGASQFQNIKSNFWLYISRHCYVNGDDMEERIDGCLRWRAAEQVEKGSARRVSSNGYERFHVHLSRDVIHRWEEGH